MVTSFLRVRTDGKTDTVLESSHGDMSADKIFQLKAQKLVVSCRLVVSWRFITTTAKSHRINLAIKIKKIQELQLLFNWMFRYMNMVLQDLIININNNFISKY